MIAVDTNILVYAHREDSPWHNIASRKIAELAEGRASWAIPWPCLCEFFAIVTHPRIYDPPTSVNLALDQIDAWLESPGIVLLSEGINYWTTLRSMITDGKVMGPQVHDARIAALCRSHGIRVLWTADRDFSRYAQLVVKNPLVAQ